MTLLVLGLIVFLGAHSMRIVADGWRASVIERRGLNAWKAAISIASVVGVALIAIGYGAARGDPVWLWTPPVWTRHLAALLTLPAFVLLASAFGPDNRIRAAVGHPMVLGVKLWALAHLLANGTLADVLLFGGFLIWAIASFAAARRRDRTAAVTRSVGTPTATMIAVGAGVLAWAAFAFWLHRWLIGVAPFG
ncbi:MAG: NnrU family protein [Proteobacteria bacterium]|nr:NnrU family protein [Burkholderiales bacterium]